MLPSALRKIAGISSNLRDPVPDHDGIENRSPGRCRPYVRPVFDNVQNPFHDETKGSAIVIQHQHLNRSRIGCGRSLQGSQLVAPLFQRDVEANQGQDLASILRDPLAARHFHLRHRELLQPRQRAERYGHAGIARAREQQEGLLFLSGRRQIGGFFSQRAIPCFRNHAGALGQAKHVQDERNFAVPHDARAGKCFHRLELFAQRLHHDFFGVVDLIDDQPEPPLIGLQLLRC